MDSHLGSAPALASPANHVARLGVLAEEAGASELAAEAAALAERLAEGRFFVACIGQYKRGKSTLLNALVGQDVLPVGVVPITAAATVLRHGPVARARVRLGAEWREIRVGDLSDYVSERGNPSNEKGVSIVEVFAPSPLLAAGMCLVDTPGVGSVIVANTETTKEFVPQIDAALLVLGADPPISSDELALVMETVRQGATLMVVLSKADRLNDAERHEALEFSRRVLAERLGRPIGRIFEVSASERLATGAASRDWAALEQALQALGARSGAAMIRAAAVRGAARLQRRLLAEVDEQRNALCRPVAESEQRVTALRACLADAERALGDLAYLLKGEQARLRVEFGRHRDTFLARALPQAAVELDAAMRDITTGGREEFRRRSLERAGEIAETLVKTWRQEAAPVGENLYRQAARRFAELANALLARLVASDERLGDLPRAVDPEQGFRTASRAYFSELITRTTRPPERWLLEKFLPPVAARRAAEREAHAYLEQLFATNAAGVVEDLDQRVLESRRRLEADIRSSIEQISTSAVRALERARERYTEGSEAVHRELARLDDLRARIAVEGPEDETTTARAEAAGMDSGDECG